MNERILELAKQATIIEVLSGRGFDETQYTERFNKEKFAKLIVVECANFLKDKLDDHFAAEQLEEHFGVVK
jgi:hypothetical protein